VAAGTNFVLLRMLSDYIALPDKSLPPWITVLQHSMVPTKPKPEGFEGNWPKSMGAVCRNDKVFKARYGDCYIDTMPPRPGRKTSAGSARTWAIAVLREEVIGDGTPALGGEEWKGKVVGVRDKMKEVAQVDKDGNPTGETKMVRQYVKINQGWKNFFALLSGHAGHFKTVLDRDYWITREGMGQDDTVYTITPADSITFPADHPKFPGQKFDLRDAAQRAEFYPDMPDLRKIVAEQASNEFFNRFFVPEDRLYGDGSKGPEFGTKKAPAGSPAAGGPPTPGNAPATPKTEASAPNMEALAALKSRITGGGDAPAAAAAETPAAAAPEAPAETPAAAAEQPETAPATAPA